VCRAHVLIYLAYILCRATYVASASTFLTALCTPLTFQSWLLLSQWNLENSDEDWSPPDDLNDFIKKAKADEKPLVYIGVRLSLLFFFLSFPIPPS
jgi:hypothetical protein